MNLRKQVEPLKKAALQASSLQRHAHHAASRLTWMKRWLKRAYRHHAQSRELKLWRDLNVSFARLARSARHRVLTVRHYFRISADPRGGLATGRRSLERRSPLKSSHPMSRPASRQSAECAVKRRFVRP